MLEWNLFTVFKSKAISGYFGECLKKCGDRKKLFHHSSSLLSPTSHLLSLPLLTSRPGIQRMPFGCMAARPETPTWSRVSTAWTRCCGCRWAWAPWRRPRPTPGWRGHRCVAGWTGCWRATGRPQTSAPWDPVSVPSCSDVVSPSGAPPAPTPSLNWPRPERTGGSGSRRTRLRRTRGTHEGRHDGADVPIVADIYLFKVCATSEWNRMDESKFGGSERKKRNSTAEKNLLLQSSFSLLLKALCVCVSVCVLKWCVRRTLYLLLWVFYMFRCWRGCSFLGPLLRKTLIKALVRAQIPEINYVFIVIIFILFQTVILRFKGWNSWMLLPSYT